MSFYRNFLALGSIPQQPVGAPLLFPTSGLLAYFPFEQNVLDYKGIYHGANGGVTFGPGKYGNGAIFDANSDYITIPAVGGSTITVAFHYYYGGVGTDAGWNTLLARNTGTYHHLLIQDSDKVIGFYNAAWYPSSKALVPGTWYHVIMEKSGVNEKIYIDNVLVLDSNSSFDNNTYNLSIIGNFTSASGTQGAIGTIDELGIWNRALTADEKAALFAGVTYTPPVFSASSVAGLSRWYNADSLALANGAAVATLTDLAGVSNMVGAGTYATNKLNGHAGITFNGTSAQTMQANGLTNPFTLFIVAKREAATDGRILTALYPGRNWLAGWHSAAYSDGLYAEGWVTYSAQSAITSPLLYTVKQTGAASSLYKNQALIASNALGLTAPDNKLCLGGMPAYGEYANSCFFEMLIYNGSLSDIDRNTVENYLKIKYNL